MDEVEQGLAFRGGDPRVGKGLELVGMQMQGLADQERGFRDWIGRAVGEGKLRLDEAADGIADEIDQGEQLAAIAELVGDVEAARRVELILPETGVCSGPAVLQEAGCCGGPAKVDASACCAADESAKKAGASGCGCS